MKKALPVLIGFLILVSVVVAELGPFRSVHVTETSLGAWDTLVAETIYPYGSYSGIPSKFQAWKIINNLTTAQLCSAVVVNGSTKDTIPVDVPGTTVTDWFPFLADSLIVKTDSTVQILAVPNR